MPKKLVSAEDYANIANLMGAYMWLADSGDEAAWAELFVDDVVFTGIPPQTLEGLAQVRQIPTFASVLKGKYRHLNGSFFIEYGDSKDEAYYNYYALMTTWTTEHGPQFDDFALARIHMLRIDGEWKIKRNDIQLLKNKPE